MGYGGVVMSFVTVSIGSMENTVGRERADVIYNILQMVVWYTFLLVLNFYFNAVHQHNYKYLIYNIYNIRREFLRENETANTLLHS